MSIREIEEEIKGIEDEIREIEKVKGHYKSGSLGRNNIEAIITEKRRKISRLKTQEDGEEEFEEDDISGSCGGDCGSCGGVR
jgi:hypothetical protein